MLPGGSFASVSTSASAKTPLGDPYSIGYSGASAYMNLNTPSDMNFDWDADSYSAFAWVYVESVANFQVLIGKGQSSVGTQNAIFLGITNTGQPYLYLGGLSVNGTAASISGGNWYCIGYTASAGVGKLYVNGVQSGSDLAIGSYTSSEDLMVGATRYNDSTGDSFPFYGLFHNVAFWNVALTAGQVLGYYNAGVPVSPSIYYPTGLIHWYRMGNNTSDFVTTAFRVTDNVGTDHGTLTNFDSNGNGALYLKSPGSSANTYAYLTTSSYSPLYQFRADDFTAATNWVSNFGSYTATYSNGPGSSVQQNSSFSGIKEATVGDIFTMAADAVHGVSSSTAITYAFVYYTGALDGSGGFFAGSDDNGGADSHVRLFNYFYAKDIGARVYNDAGGDNEISGLNSVHTNKYVMIHVTVDLPNTSLKTYVNGFLLNTQTLSGTFTANSNMGFGIMSVWKTGGGHYESTASGQKFIEFTRYDSVLTPRQIAIQAAGWNTIKGYY